MPGVNNDDIQLIHYSAFAKDWIAHFMSRHPQLASARRKLIEAASIKDVSMEQLTKWFDDLQSIINDYDIEPGNMYNMDKSGFAIGDIEASQQIINTTIRQAFQSKPGRQEWFTSNAFVLKSSNLSTYIPNIFFTKRVDLVNCASLIRSLLSLDSHFSSVGKDAWLMKLSSELK